MAIDNNELKIVLEQLAAQANLSTLQKSGPSLPSGWSNLSTFKSTSNRPPPVPPTQGFLSMGWVGDTKIAVLALGMTWVNYLQNKFDGYITQIPLPAQIAKGAPTTATIDSTFLNAYLQIQGAVWNSLKQYLNNLPLYICGMSLGGPLAQMAALDLRPGNTGPAPDSMPAPAGPTPSYVFSTGNIGNSSFAVYYNGLISNAYSVQAGSTTVKVDFFPTQPNNTDFSLLGSLQMVDVKIPAVDVPWLERGDTFYLTALGGTPVSGPVTTPSIPNPPAGFSQEMAYTTATLTAALYHLAQHPDGTVSGIAPYSIYKMINSNDVPFACIFTSSDKVVVAFRGSVTWQEFYSQDANSTFATVTFSDGQVHQGAYDIYSAPTDSTDPTSFSFADYLKGQLAGVLPQRKLFLAGHGLGGTLANIAAMDFANGSEVIAVNGIYTFGAVYSGNYDFSDQYGSLLGDVSFQINRPSDKIGAAIMFRGFAAVNSAVTLNGQLAIEESTYHSLAGYLQLLDTSS